MDAKLLLAFHELVEGVKSTTQHERPVHTITLEHLLAVAQALDVKTEYVKRLIVDRDEKLAAIEQQNKSWDDWRDRAAGIRK